MERTRYNRVGNSPKDTLVTIAEGDTLYFGIARCGPADRPLKSLGRSIAKGRALQERNDEVPFVDENTFSVHNSGLRGVCHKSRVKELLDYFRDIKRNCLSDTKPGNGVNYPLNMDPERAAELAGLE